MCVFWTAGSKRVFCQLGRCFTVLVLRGGKQLNVMKNISRWKRVLIYLLFVLSLEAFSHRESSKSYAANIDLSSFHERVPGFFISGDKAFVAALTDENKEEWVLFSSSLSFGGYYRRTPVGEPMTAPPGLIENIRARKPVDRAEQLETLWRWLHYKFEDIATPDRFKIPYAFAFELTPEEHRLCKAEPDAVLSVVKNKKALLTWMTPEIQWGDSLRVKYLRSYIEELKKHGHNEWARTVESLENERYHASLAALLGDLTLSANKLNKEGNWEAAAFLVNGLEDLKLKLEKEIPASCDSPLP